MKPEPSPRNKSRRLENNIIHEVTETEEKDEGGKGKNLLECEYEENEKSATTTNNNDD